MKVTVKKSVHVLKKTMLCLALASSCNFAYSLAPDSNPFAGADFYVDPDYAAKVDGFFKTNPDYKNKAEKLNLLGEASQWNISTAIWLDRKAAIYDSEKAHGVYWHLENAYKKAAATTVVSFVVYDLPGRDCDAFSSNGEIKIGLDKAGKPDVKKPLLEYKNNYIDPINKELTRFYSDYPDAVNRIRTVLIIEPDSLPNMITNKDHTDNFPNSCKVIADHHVYERGIRYALQTFSASSYPVYQYLDIAHSGWLGWKSNANQIYKVYNEKGDSNVKNYPYSDNEGGLGSGFKSVRGFITNTANYTPFQESFNASFDERQNYEFYTEFSNSMMNKDFYQWNDSYDEASYIAEILSLDNSSTPQLHFDSQHDHRIIRPANGSYYKRMHFIVDTSRNNWVQADVNNYDFMHKDQRHHRGNWCNVENIRLSNSQITGAGLGVRPIANPVNKNPLFNPLTDPDSYQTLPIDAYVWVKPPGESDGNFDPVKHTGDQMCGNGTGGNHNQNSPTDAMQAKQKNPAPRAGVFFPEAFRMLIDNASD